MHIFLNHGTLLCKYLSARFCYEFFMQVNIYDVYVYMIVIK